MDALIHDVIFAIYIIHARPTHLVSDSSDVSHALYV